jgi:pimeloyl-ACP methyl ester carboxylesterase
MATYLLIHGAWHGGWCWRRVVPLLRAAGHEVLTPTLTGLGERAHLLTREVGLDTHAQDVVGELEYEDLRDVVLVGHSYGGMVITAVAERAAERLAHLVYLDAFVPRDSQSQMDLLGPEFLALFQEQAELHGDGWKLPSFPAERFGVTKEEDLAWVRPRLGPHPFKTKLDKVRLANPKAAKIARTYIYCSDPAIGPFGQFAERARAEAGWRYRELATGHDAMVTEPKRLAEMLMEVATAGAASVG